MQSALATLNMDMQLVREVINQWLNWLDALGPGRQALAVAAITAVGAGGALVVRIAARAIVRRLRRTARIKPRHFFPVRHRSGQECFVIVQDVQITASHRTPASVSVFLRFKEKVTEDWVSDYDCPPAATAVPGWEQSIHNHHHRPMLLFPLNLEAGNSAAGHVAFRVWRMDSSPTVPPSRDQAWLRFVDNTTGKLIAEFHVRTFIGLF